MYPQRIHFPEEGAFVHTQGFGGSEPVTVAGAQRFQDSLGLNMLSGGGNGHGKACLYGIGMQVFRQALQIDGVAAGTQYKGMLNDVFQFAHITGEIVYH